MPPGIGYGQPAAAASAIKQRLPQIGANGQVGLTAQPPQAQAQPAGVAQLGAPPQLDAQGQPINAASAYVPGDPTQQAAAAGGFDPSQLNVSGPQTGVQPAPQVDAQGQPLAQQASLMDGARYQQMLQQGFAPEQIERLAGAFQNFRGQGGAQAQQAPGAQVGNGQAVAQPAPQAQAQPIPQGQAQPQPVPAGQAQADDSWMRPWENTATAGATPGHGGGALTGGYAQPAPQQVAAQPFVPQAQAQPVPLPVIDPVTGQVIG